MSCPRMLICFVLGLLATVDVQADGSTAGIDAAFEAAMERYHLPGLAIGVVQDGRVIYARTEGELVAGEGRRIDTATLFKIASNSKAMTTGVLARLVDQGKLDWHDPVVKYLPDFRMYDPWVTREMQVRDLLVHNSGMGAGAGDLMLWPEPNLFTRADVIHGLRYLKPLYSFRSRYAYDNTLYIVAGEVAAAAGGAPYETLVRRELFEPLRMTRCQVGEWRRDAVGNVAQPHRRVDGRNVVVRADGETIANVPMTAAGGIRCSLDDMLKWIGMWLQPERVGLVDGKPWLSAAQREAVWTAQMPMPLSKRMREWDDSHFSAYGYGWRLTDVDGTQKVSHTGTLSGMYSAVTLLPEKDVGFVILMNGDADEARTVLTQVLVKHFTSPGRHHSVADYAQRIAAETATFASTSTVAAASPRTPATRADLSRWLGIYRDPWLGEVSICEGDNGFRFAAAKSPALSGGVYRSGKRLLVDWDDASVDTEAWLDFAQAETRGVTTLKMAKVDPEADFSSDFEDLAFSRIRHCPGT